VDNLLVSAKVPCSLTVYTLKMEALRYFEALVITRSTRRHIPEGDILILYVFKFHRYIYTEVNFNSSILFVSTGLVWDKSTNTEAIYWLIVPAHG
jgi:hypothetical protein